MMKRLSIAIISLCASLITASCHATMKSAYTWNRLQEGLLYANYSFALTATSRSTIHAFQIDPAKYRFEVLIAPDEKEGTTAQKLATKHHALLVINGGFFTPEHLSIGFIARNGKQLRPLHKTSWWSVFAMRKGQPEITPPGSFTMNSDVSMALQVGPRLAIDGRIPKLKEGISSRSAIGITRDGKIIIAITNGYGLSLQELAKRMSRTRYQGGLECPNAMALDGGNSSQLFAKIDDFQLSLESLARITNGIGVFPLKR